VLGAADIAQRAVIPAILDAGDQIAAVASRNPQRSRLLAAEFGLEQDGLTYQELVESNVDAIYIPLPNSLHLTWTLRALAAGKHVLCEKPLALTAAEGREMVQAAEEHEVVLAEAVMYRYHPRWQVVHQTIAQGRVGQIRHLRGTFSFSLGPPPDIRWEEDLGGGALYDLGSYLLNACRWLAGEPDRVLGRAHVAHGVDGDGSLLLEFPAPDGPVSAELAFSFEAAEHQVFEVIGKEGSLLIPKPFTAWRGEAIPLWLSEAAGEPARPIQTPAADPYTEMVRAFRSRVHGGPELLLAPRDSERGLRLLDAARQSIFSQSWIQLAETVSLEP
jgi:predicted dehydrogenase